MKTIDIYYKKMKITLEIAETEDETKGITVTRRYLIATRQDVKTFDIETSVTDTEEVMKLFENYVLKAWKECTNVEKKTECYENVKSIIVPEANMLKPRDYLSWFLTYLRNFIKTYNSIKSCK